MDDYEFSDTSLLNDSTRLSQSSTSTTSEVRRHESYFFSTGPMNSQTELDRSDLPDSLIQDFESDDADLSKIFPKSSKSELIFETASKKPITNQIIDDDFDIDKFTAHLDHLKNSREPPKMLRASKKRKICYGKSSETDFTESLPTQIANSGHSEFSFFQKAGDLGKNKFIHPSKAALEKGMKSIANFESYVRKSSTPKNSRSFTMPRPRTQTSKEKAEKLLSKTTEILKKITQSDFTEPLPTQFDSTSKSDISKIEILSTDSGFSGFSTGTGNKVEISQSAIDRSRNKMDKPTSGLLDSQSECGKKLGMINSATGFSGFSTGSGKKVEISEQALAQTSGFAGFSTGAGKKVEISEQALAKTSGFTGFSTGSGRKVKISDEAIAKSSEFTGTDSGKKDETSKKALSKPSGFSGFSSGSGRKIHVSELTMDKIRTPGTSNAASLSTASDRKVEISEDENSKPGFSGFSTATGKKVTISESALNFAKNSERESTGFQGFSTGLGKKVEVSEETLKMTRKADSPARTIESPSSDFFASIRKNFETPENQQKPIPVFDDRETDNMDTSPPSPILTSLFSQRATWKRKIAEISGVSELPDTPKKRRRNFDSTVRSAIESESSDDIEEIEKNVIKSLLENSALYGNYRPTHEGDSWLDSCKWNERTITIFDKPEKTGNVLSLNKKYLDAETDSILYEFLEIKTKPQNISTLSNSTVTTGFSIPFKKNEKRVEAQKQNFHTPGFNAPVKQNPTFVPPTKSTPIGSRVPQIPHLPLSPIREKSEDESDGEFDDSLPPMPEIPEETSCLTDNQMKKLEDLRKNIKAEIEAFLKKKPQPEKQPLRPGTLYGLKKYHADKKETIKLTALKRNENQLEIPVDPTNFIFNLFDFYNLDQEMDIFCQ